MCIAEQCAVESACLATQHSVEGTAEGTSEGASSAAISAKYCPDEGSIDEGVADYGSDKGRWGCPATRDCSAEGGVGCDFGRSGSS